MSATYSNDETRLILLDDYYRDMYIEPQGKIMKHSRLDNICGTLLNANQIYLLDKKLLDGKLEFTGAGIIAFPSRITAKGVDIVEKILFASTPKLSSSIAQTISKISEIAQKFHALVEFFLSDPDVRQSIMEVIREIFENIL